MKFKTLLFIPTVFVLATGGCSFNINVANKSLYIATLPTKVEYNVGQSLSLDGLRLIDADSGESIIEYTSSPSEGYVFTNNDVRENFKITLSKPNYKSTSYSVRVVNLAPLTISSYPKVTYTIGEYFSLEGLVVTCNGEVITGYTSSFTVGNRLNTAGIFTVEISKAGYASAYYDITVNAANALKIGTMPNKVTYTVGEVFDSTGLVVLDQNDVAVNDYTCSISDGTILKYSGVSTVTISKDTYESASFDITVEEGGGGEVTYRDFKIYYVNDTHGSFIRESRYSEAGISYISSYMKSQVALDPNNSIVLSGGDMFQGGYESNETHGKIMIEAMNEIGFDAMVLGNHEFDWGESYIEGFKEQLNCPIISSNTFYSYDNVTRPNWLEPYTIITRGDLKVGIIGAAENNLGSSITGSISEAFYFPQANEYIKYYSTYLRQNENCDIIIAGFHDGGFEGYNGNPTQYEDLTQIDPSTGSKYVDAMFFAHDHYVKSGVYNDVPYLEAGCNGKYVGVMELSLKGNGVVYTIDSVNPYTFNAYKNCTTSDPAIEAIAQKEEYVEILARGADVIYTFANSYSKDDFTYIVTLAMYWYVNNHKSMFDNTTVYFASHNTGGIRSEVFAGDFTRRDLIKVFPFDNQLTIQTCTSTNISNMRNSSYYRTYEASEIIYDASNYTKAVSITYISEYKYAYYYQVGYVKYDMTAKDALVDYLTNGGDHTL